MCRRGGLYTKQAHTVVENIHGNANYYAGHLPHIIIIMAHY